MRGSERERESGEEGEVTTEDTGERRDHKEDGVT